MHERSADLERGRSEVEELSEIVDSEVDTLRSALRAVQDGRRLSDEAARTSAQELNDILDRAAYRQDMARIRSLTSAIQTSLDEEKS